MSGRSFLNSLEINLLPFEYQLSTDNLPLIYFPNAKFSMLSICTLWSCCEMRPEYIDDRT